MTAAVIRARSLKLRLPGGVIAGMPQPRLAGYALLGLLAVTAAGFALQQYRRAEALAAALAAAQQEVATTATPTVRTKPSNHAPAVAPEPESARADGEEPADSEPAAQPPRPPRDRGGDRNPRAEFAARMEKLMADPEFVQATQLQQRARLDRNYAELFAKLNLPPTQLEALKNLLAERQNSTRDVVMAAREEGLGRENRDEVRALIETTQAEIDNEIRASIGEQNYAELKFYEQTGPQRNLVEQLSDRLSYSATPLNSAQSEALVKILAETAPTAGPGTGREAAFTAGFAGRLPGGAGNVSITAETLARAQGVLSATQLSALTDLQAEQQAAQKITQLMRDARTPARETGAAATTGPGTGG